MAYAYTGTINAAPLAERDAQPTIFARILRAMTESRMRAAMREIRAREHLFNQGDIATGGLPPASLKTDGSLPFTR